MDRRVLWSFVVFLSVGPGVGWADNRPVEITVLDRDTGKPVPCRLHLKDAAGKPQRAPGLPFWFDHFACPGAARLDLAPGRYTYEAERGPEYRLAAGSFTVREGEGPKVSVTLERLVDLAAEGWWPGDLHVHRPAGDIELLMRAEDLHVAPVITWWNNRNRWDREPPPPTPWCASTATASTT